MRSLTLKQLRAVESIARCGTITAAAGELHVTPAALTARLKQIESALSLALFDRTNEGLRTTEAGEAVLETAESMAASLSDCAQRLDMLRGLGGGRVAISVVSTAKYFAPYAIAAFSRRHPQIRMELFVGNREETIDRLGDYSTDIALMGRPAKDFPVEHAVIGDHPLVVVAPPDHRLTARKRVKVRELVDETFLVRESGSGTRKVFESLVERMGGARPSIAMEIGSNETIKQAVMAGLGVALLSAHVIGAEVADGRLRVLAVDGLPIRRQWYAVRRTDRHPGPAVQAFWDFMRREGAALLPQVADPR